MRNDPEKHRRRSIRLKGYDYSQAGAYFVTVCAWNKECIFGDVENGEMCLNEHGQVVENEWLQTESIRSNVEIDTYVIMPNHFHGILVLHEDNVGARRCLAPENRTNVKWIDNSNRVNEQNRTNHQSGATHRIAPTGLKQGSIGAIIGQFKSIVTKQINQIRNTPGTPVWQRNYYEHIIRNENELYAIREYIQNNPFKWDLDENNPVNIKQNVVVGARCPCP